MEKDKQPNSPRVDQDNNDRIILLDLGPSQTHNHENMPYPLDLFYERLASFNRKKQEQEDRLQAERYQKLGIISEDDVTPRYEIPLLGADDD